MKIKTQFAFGICFIAAVMYGAASPSAAISGIVLDVAGKPVAGAKVTYHTTRQLVAGRLGVPMPTGPIVNGFAMTDGAGAFSIQAPSSGTYYLCAYGVRADQLATCEWSGGEAPVSVQAGQSADNVGFMILTGTLVTFNVSDPNHRIVDLSEVPTASGLLPLSGSTFSLGVFSGPSYKRATLLSTTPSGRVYQIAVPAMGHPRVFLDTRLQVTDSSGTSLPIGKPGEPLDVGSQSSISIALMVQ
jgi:hypothetical protein